MEMAGRDFYSNCISIHSTTQVETQKLLDEKKEKPISIHSTTQVETKSALEKEYQLLISIHSTTQVETQVDKMTEAAGNISIHSTTQVETIIYIKDWLKKGFQSTPPRRWRHTVYFSRPKSV